MFRVVTTPGDISTLVNADWERLLRWATTAKDEPNYGEGLAGMPNLMYGAYKVSVAAPIVAAAIVGAPIAAAIPVVGPATDGAALAYGGYQLLSGAWRLYRGERQLPDALEHPTLHRSPASQAGHLILGLLPAGDSIEGVLGGLP
jgi:hypothetical protein